MFLWQFCSLLGEFGRALLVTLRLLVELRLNCSFHTSLHNLTVVWMPKKVQLENAETRRLTASLEKAQAKQKANDELDAAKENECDVCHQTRERRGRCVGCPGPCRLSYEECGSVLGLETRSGQNPPFLTVLLAGHAKERKEAQKKVKAAEKLQNIKDQVLSLCQCSFAPFGPACMTD